MNSRREFVKTLAAGALIAQQRGTRTAPPSRTGRIDVHHHRITGSNEVRGQAWSVAIALEQMEKYNDIKFIIVHSGGTLPVLAGRIQDRVPRNRPDLYPTGALELLKNMYYEVAHATFPWAVAAMMKFTTTSHILFGTDYPQEPIESTAKYIPELGLSADILRAIDRGNAEVLFPRFKS